MSTVLKSPEELRTGWRLPRWDKDRWQEFSPFTANDHGEGGGDPPDAPKKPWRPGWGSAIAGLLILAIVVFLMIFDWNWLRGPIGRYASARTGRTVVLEGDLKVKLLTLTPRVDIGGLKVGNPAWGPKENMAEVGNIAVSAKLLPLLTGRVILPLVSVAHPNVSLLSDAQGRTNWDFSNGEKTAPKPFKLPPIQTFVISDGRLRLNDIARKLNFAGTINANEQSTTAYERGFRLSGKGELNRRLFTVNVTGGPLVNVRQDRPYPFDADIRAGATRITAKGQAPKPFDLGLLNAAVAVQGVDLNDLYYLTGLAFPNTPPYRISGQLRRDGNKYWYDKLTGRVGNSDVNGDATVTLDDTGRPFLKAKLNSRRLDFVDLGSLFGNPGASKVAAPGQKAEARTLAAQGRFLPDATLQADRMRAMDAEVIYTAAEVNAPNLPLRTVTLGAKLDHGVLNLDPIRLKFPSGELTGVAKIDARKDTPISEIDLRVSNVRLEEFLQTDGPPPLTGTLLGRAKLTGSGNTVHKAAANADGAVTAVIPKGQIRRAFAELMGINASKGLFLLLGKDQSPADVRCALADFDVRSGVLYARRIVFDTGPVLVNGEGTVNLDTEAMDLRFKGKPKKLRAMRVAAPITVGGRLREPKFGVDAGAAAAQVGVAVALGAVLSPLAAILPFVSPGLEKDANCAGLLAEARASEAPVRAATSSTTAAKPKG